MRLIFRNLRLKVRKLHIRYEDDYFQAALGKKFAFGVTVRDLSVHTGQDDWKFKADFGSHNHHNQTHADFTRVPMDTQYKYRESNSESANLLIKEISANQLQIYYDNTGQIMVPQDLVEEAINLN